MTGEIDRRTVVGVLALGVAALLTGCSDDEHGAAPAGAAGSVSPRATASVPTPPRMPEVLTHGAATGRRVALTVDDGYDVETVAGYVDFAKATGIPLTFSPNGAFQHAWNRHAPVLRPLIEAGQVQIGNHTFLHHNMLQESDKVVAEDIERNERWISKTFGTSSLPYLRPPYGAHDARTDKVAASLGYTKILMWNATFDDAAVVSHKHILRYARYGMKPGAIVVGHANHPRILGALDEIRTLIKKRRLDMVTLDTMFGTTRI